MKNKTTTECWNILRGELDSAIHSYVPMKKQGNRSKEKHLSKRLSERLHINNICGGFINIRERIQIMINCRVFSRTRSIDLHFVSYGEFGELIMKVLRAALGLWLLAAHARGALPEKS